MKSIELLIALLLLAGCQRGQANVPTSTFAPEPTPTIWVIKTVVGVGRDLQGPLLIDGDCVRVNGEALAWSLRIKATVEGKRLHIQKWNGEVMALQEGDDVLALGGCEFKEGFTACVTPSMKEKGAQSACEIGPYFVVGNIRQVIAPTPPLPSP